MFKNVLWCLLILGLIDSPLNAQVELEINPISSLAEKKEAINYLRFSDNEESLQVALVRFKPRSGDKSWFVDLVSAIHVADKSYYDELNNRFKEYDAVLYELVAPEGTKIPFQPAVEKQPKDAAQETGLQRAKNPITFIQTLMTDILGLSFQMDAIDYTSNHFIHADFSPQEFAASMEARGESV